MQATELKERSSRMVDKCKASYEAGERSQALNRFQELYNTVSVLRDVSVVTLNV